MARITFQDEAFDSNVPLIFSRKLLAGFFSKFFQQYLLSVCPYTKSLKQICSPVFLDWNLGLVSSWRAVAIDLRIHHKYHVIHVSMLQKCQISCFIFFTVHTGLFESI